MSSSKPPLPQRPTINITDPRGQQHVLTLEDEETQQEYHLARWILDKVLLIRLRSLVPQQDALTYDKQLQLFDKEAQARSILGRVTSFGLNNTGRWFFETLTPMPPTPFHFGMLQAGFEYPLNLIMLHRSLLQIASQLYKLHAHGFMHIQVCPANIYYNFKFQESRLEGLAGVCDTGADVLAVRSNAFMAPELLTGLHRKHELWGFATAAHTIYFNCTLSEQYKSYCWAAVNNNQGPIKAHPSQDVYSLGLSYLFIITQLGMHLEPAFLSSKLQFLLLQMVSLETRWRPSLGYVIAELQNIPPITLLPPTPVALLSPKRGRSRSLDSYERLGELPERSHSCG